jgi:ribosome biogenesis GTPase / thiamine phosphate phosphatase
MEVLGKVVTTTRRSAVVMIDSSSPGEKKFIKTAISNQIEDLCVGDAVSLALNENNTGQIEEGTAGVLIKNIEPRKNCLFRSQGTRRKNICSNLDLALIITAPGLLGNTIFIDRVLAATTLEKIPARLVINKCDLEGTEELQYIYKEVSVDVQITSAKTGTGMEDIKQLLLSPELETVVLCGISGVGKSSILNYLLPSVARRTQTVSRKTGQGQQTTTQAYGYLMPRDGLSPLLMVDTPGVQNFGLSHLTTEECRQGFSDFVKIGLQCEFRDCAHVEEQNCAVLKALEEGVIPASRYSTYLNICEELIKVEKYKYN